MLHCVSSQFFFRNLIQPFQKRLARDDRYTPVMRFEAGATRTKVSVHKNAVQISRDAFFPPSYVPNSPCPASWPKMSDFFRVALLTLQSTTSSIFFLSWRNSHAIYTTNDWTRSDGQFRTKKMRKDIRKIAVMSDGIICTGKCSTGAFRDFIRFLASNLYKAQAPILHASITSLLLEMSDFFCSACLAHYSASAFLLATKHST